MESKIVAAILEEAERERSPSGLSKALWSDWSDYSDYLDVVPDHDDHSDNWTDCCE